jgi:hypothetical protein
MQEWIQLKEDEEEEGVFFLIIDPTEVAYKDEGTHEFNLMLSDDVSPANFNSFPLKVLLTYV